jgi:uncharacterized membrane protein
MEDALKTIASTAALGLELLVVIFILFGAIETLIALGKSFRSEFRGEHNPHIWRRDVWMRFAAWILLALEFALGADIVRTAVAPTWQDIGKLAAIAAIRTGLGFFLGRDISEFVAPDDRPAER